MSYSVLIYTTGAEVHEVKAHFFFNFIMFITLSHQERDSTIVKQFSSENECSEVQIVGSPCARALPLIEIRLYPRPSR